MTSRRNVLLMPLALKAGDDILASGRRVTRLYSSGYPKPFLYPILAPDGTELSRGWPISPREGDSKDHDWHRGIWWGHGDINGHDFWREQKGTATIRVDKVTHARAPTVQLHQTLVTAAGSSLARLQTIYRFRATDDLLQIDAILKLRGNQPLRFGDTDDGGFAVRLREEFRLDRGASMINSRGQSGKSIWGQPAEWTSYSARVNAKTYGVSILSHPSNLRHPSGWHARPYGLNSANPFAASSFAEETSGQRGAYTLPKGSTLRLMYRVLVHNGDADIAQRYSEYANEPAL